MRELKRFVAPGMTLVLAGMLGGVLVLAAAYLYLNPRIPDAESYRHVNLKTPLRIYSRSGDLIQEYGERLEPLTFDEIPPLFINALLDTEDKRFFRHEGIDLITVMNATFRLFANRGEIRSGASTITMQLARNISLSKEQKFIRKFKEMLLALKIERQLTKQEILTLYLNVIPFGKHAYGLRAAADVYYGKKLDELNLAQLAMLAGIPKRPESGNPINGPKWALERRNLVLRRMREQGSITPEEYEDAVVAPITASVYGRTVELPAFYVSEMVRERLLRDYGTRIYTDGFDVVTTLDTTMQTAAHLSLRKELEAYDRRHGYRGPEKTRLEGYDQYLASPEYGYPTHWIKTLDNTPVIADQEPAIVVGMEDRSITVLTKEETTVDIPWESLNWARPFLTINSRGRAPESPADFLAVGDLIRIVPDGAGGWALGEIPAVEGALIALDPKNGAIRALIGGYDFDDNQFNHVTLARRQPGSDFKPFVYAGALESGMTAATVFNDAPLVLPGGEQEQVYRPTNAGDSFRGNITLREALYRSINLVSMRVLLAYGAENAVDYVKRFGFDTRNFPHDVQLALGGGTIALTPLELATAYATFANGGFKITPYLIERIAVSTGDIIFTARPDTVCLECDPAMLPGEPAPRVVDARVAYIMDSMLRDVIRRGTGSRAHRILKRDDLRGKTGTTNDADIWFSGFNRNLVATTWVGFDNNTPVGDAEFGATAPLTIWTDFMARVLPPQEAPDLPQPNGIVMVRIDPKTGLRASASDKDAVFEIFREEYAPSPVDGLAQKQEKEEEATQIIF